MTIIAMPYPPNINTWKTCMLRYSTFYILSYLKHNSILCKGVKEEIDHNGLSFQSNTVKKNTYSQGFEV